MPHYSLRLSNEIALLLKTRTTQKKLPLSTYLKKLIEEGLRVESEKEEKEALPSHRKVERYLLFTTLQCLLLLRHLIPKNDEACISKISEEASQIAKALLNKKPIPDNSEDNASS